MTGTSLKHETKRAAPSPTCLYVIGMHRSGTSAVAALSARLGLAMPPADDRIPATASNRQGHYESRQLVAFNHRLLLRLGGTWTAPPELTPGWVTSAELGDLRREAARLFAMTYPSRPAAWKDPRLCLLLPFWRTVIEPPAAAVLVVRDPVEVARSLHARDGLGPLLSLALWERYVRSACAALVGLPTLLVDYAQLVGDPVRGCGQLADFLRPLGVDAPALSAEQIAEVLDPALRRQGGKEASHDRLGDSAGRIMERLQATHGPHASWQSPELHDEPGWVTDVLAMRRRLDRVSYELGDVQRSRAYRLAGWARGHRRSA